MPELRTVVDNLRLQYQGIFNFRELYTLIDRWYRDRGYDKYEVRNSEQHLPTGIQLEIELHPWKKITLYEETQHKITIIATDLKDVMVTKNGKKVKMQEGKLMIFFTVYLRTDYLGKWDSKPYFVFLRGIFDQVIYKSFIDRDMKLLSEEINHLYNVARTYLNMNKF